jgi:hypothetical protein
MKFNGELKMMIPVLDHEDGEPTAYAIVENKKARGGIIPYAQYDDQWVANPVPTRPLIRSLVKMCDTYSAVIKDLEGVNNGSTTSI